MEEQRQASAGAIRPCETHERHCILQIVNDAAEAYRNVIPESCWHEPYMSAAELDREMAAGVRFSGYEAGGRLAGVMGLQNRGDVDLIRHAYVLPAAQRRGVGRALLASFLHAQKRPMLVGTWRAAHWAIRFYERNGFECISDEMIPVLLRSYWTVSDLQIANSVVLSRV